MIGARFVSMSLFPVVVAFLIFESEGSPYLTVVTIPRPVSGWVRIRNSQSRNVVVGNKDDKDGGCFDGDLEEEEEEEEEEGS